MPLLSRKRICWLIANAVGIALYLRGASKIWAPPGREGEPGSSGDIIVWGFFAGSIAVPFLLLNIGWLVLIVRTLVSRLSRLLPQLEPKGWRCGPYRLLDVIGRGGMGAVYLAERVDGEVTQWLAVKLLPTGAGNAQRERFLQERQILASLAHPNIARMLDAGHVENGRPFLAMEYVDGQPIDVFPVSLGVKEKIKMRVVISAKPAKPV